MKIEIAPYSLNHVGERQRSPRQGALLKVSFSDGSCGFADCHPWPELGDFPLDQQLKLLAEHQPTALVSRSLSFAKIDAEARAARRHLFTGLAVPKSHQLIAGTDLLSKELLEQLAADGTSIIKIKVGDDPLRDISEINPWIALLRDCGIKLRLDFNAKIMEQAFLQFLAASSKWIDCIDFFEDPFTYNHHLWEKLRKQSGIRLACDRDSTAALQHPDSCDFLVVKPAIQEVAPFLTAKRGDRRLVITSYVDHPIGQLGAAYSAAQVKAKHKDALSECGLLTHHLFEQTPFSQCLHQKGTCLIPSTEGFGWGYDALLNSLKWQRLL